jgi:magnesium-transporting ATPase (P-type)
MKQGTSLTGKNEKREERGGRWWNTNETKEKTKRVKENKLHNLITKTNRTNQQSKQSRQQQWRREACVGGCNVKSGSPPLSPFISWQNVGERERQKNRTQVKRQRRYRNDLSTSASLFRCFLLFHCLLLIIAASLSLALHDTAAAILLHLAAFARVAAVRVGGGL